MIGGTAIGDDDKATATSEVFDESKGLRGLEARRVDGTSRAAHPTRSSCPTGRWSRSAAGGGVNERALEVSPTTSARSRCYDPGTRQVAPRRRPGGGARVSLDGAAAARRPRVLRRRRRQRRAPTDRHGRDLLAAVPVQGPAPDHRLRRRQRSRFGDEFCRTPGADARAGGAVAPGAATHAVDMSQRARVAARSTATGTVRPRRTAPAAAASPRRATTCCSCSTATACRRSRAG